MCPIMHGRPPSDMLHWCFNSSYRMSCRRVPCGLSGPGCSGTQPRCRQGWGSARRRRSGKRQRGYSHPSWSQRFWSQRSATPPSPDRADHGAAVTYYRPGIPSDSTCLAYVEGLPQCSTNHPLTPHESFASLDPALRELLQLLLTHHEVQCSFCRVHVQVLLLLLQRQRWSPQHRSCPCQHLRRPRQCPAFLQCR